MSSDTLSDDEVAELQARPSTELGGYRRVLLRPRERDALCATVRALREKHHDAATRMRDRCVEKLRQLMEYETVNSERRGAFIDAVRELQSLTLEGEQEQ